MSTETEHNFITRMQASSDPEVSKLAAIAWRYQKLTTHATCRFDHEASNYVESVICMRTDFTGDPPYVGWKGLGLALNEALDERDKLRTMVDEATEALQFYADPETYFAIGFMADSPCGEFANDFDGEYYHPDMVGPRPGKRARQIIAKFDEEAKT